MKLRYLVKKIVRGYRASSDDYIKELRKRGAIVGDDVHIHLPSQTTIDMTAPFLLTIGSHVNMTGPITILTHDYSWSVIKGITGEVLGNEKRVFIGNNVFIGWGATILCGTTIPDNTIIGAHAVVNGVLDGNSVYGGIPARKICSIEEYRKKRQECQLEEAREFVAAFKSRMNRAPSVEDLDEYFFLFADDSNLCDRFEYQMKLAGTYEKSKERLGINRVFDDYDSFLRYCDRSEQSPTNSEMPAENK